MAEAEKNEPVTMTKGELKKLLDETAKDAARLVSAELLAGMVTKGSDNPGTGQIKDLADQIALSIAELSDQGTNRKRVAPEILASRAKAYEKLIKQLSEARDRADVALDAGDKVEAARWLPEYRVAAKTYLTDRIVEPWRRGANNELVPTEIIWRGIPNNSLRPINAIAIALFSTFQAWVGTEGLLRAEDSFMTPGGVVIKGEAPAGSRLAVSDEQRPSDLEIMADPSDPTATHIRVLGTIAEPARQNVARKREGAAFAGARDATLREIARPTGQANNV
jgi:hypothetical protein